MINEIKKRIEEIERETTKVPSDFILLSELKHFLKLAKKLKSDLIKDLKTDLTGCFSTQKQCDEWNQETIEIINKRLEGEEK